jgi:uncharacterized membrane protein
VTWTGVYKASVLAGLMAFGAALACAGDAGQPSPEEQTGEGTCPNDLPADSKCSASSASYHEEVAGIIAQKCAGCHAPNNGVSSKVFASYADIFEERRSMLTQVYACRMPPSEAAALSSEERHALLEWFVCGALDN